MVRIHARPPYLPLRGQSSRVTALRETPQRSPDRQELRLLGCRLSAFGHPLAADSFSGVVVQWLVLVVLSHRTGVQFSATPLRPRSLKVRTSPFQGLNDEFKSRRGRYGRMTQLAACLLYMQDARGSNPCTPTLDIPCLLLYTRGERMEDQI